jgi:hypothetical protein
MFSLLVAIVADVPALLQLLPVLDDAFAAAPGIESLVAAFASDGVVKVLTSLSFEQWISIVAKVAAAAPAAQKLWAQLHPAFAELVADVNKGLDKKNAAANARAWFVANAPQYAPGYGSDGGVIAIPNPDLKTGDAS